MATPLNTNGFSLISNTGGTGIASQLSKNITREIAMSGYGELGKQDIGWTITHAVDITRTVQSFAAIPMVDEAKHSAFAFFREAIAQSAQEQTNELIQQSTSNMERAGLNEAISGNAYTGFYSDVVSGQQAVGSLLADTPNSPEALLNFSSVDFNNNQSVTEYLDNIREYAGTINLRNSIELNASNIQSEEYGLLILMHTENKEAYSQYIKQFESQIQQNFQKELSTLQDNVKAMGYTGNVKDLKALEAFKNTQSGANASQVQQLIDATNGKINQVDRYILARIHNGDIDIQKIIASGEFNGVKLDEKSLSAFKALNIYANSDQITTTFHNDMLEKIGFKSSMQNVDLNNLKHVTMRVKEFEKALSQAGFGAINGKALSALSIKEIRAIDLSKISDTNILNAMKQYIALRDHQEILSQAKNLMGNFRMRMVSLTRKALGDSDLSQGIGQIQSGYHNAKTALKIWNKVGAPAAKKVFKFFNKTTRALMKYMPAPVRRAYLKNVKFMRTIVGKARELWGRAGSGARKMASEATKALTRKASAKTTQQIAKHATRAARSMERKLLLKAGQKVGEVVRHAAHLVSSGAIGTTGAGTVGVTTAATTTTVAAATTTTVAAGATTTTVAAGTTAASGGWSALIGAAIAVKTISIIICIIVISMICYTVGGLLQMVGSTALELDNSLLGQILNFFANLKWPWNRTPTPEQQQNVLSYTIASLFNEQYLSTNVKHQLGEGNAFYQGGKPSQNTDSSNLSISYDSTPGFGDNEENIVKGMSTYKIMGSDGSSKTYPINEYSTVKLTIAMAHAYTYPLDTQKGLQNFSLYATGLWKHLNTTEIKCKLSFCKPGNQHSKCGKLKYSCSVYDSYGALSNTYLYVEQANGRVKILTDNELKNGLYVQPNQKYLYITSGPIQQPVKGVYSCRYYVFKPNGRDDANYDSAGDIEVFDAVTKGYLYTLYGKAAITKVSKVDASSIFKEYYDDDEARTKNIYDEDGNVRYGSDGEPLDYKLNPNVCVACTEPNYHGKHNLTQFKRYVTVCGYNQVYSNGCNNVGRETIGSYTITTSCPRVPQLYYTSEGCRSVFVVSEHEELNSEFAQEKIGALMTDAQFDNYRHILREKLDKISNSGSSGIEKQNEIDREKNRLEHKLAHETITIYKCKGHNNQPAYCKDTIDKPLTLVVKYNTYGGGTDMKCINPQTQIIEHYSETKCCDDCKSVYGVPYDTWQSNSSNNTVYFTTISKYMKTFYVCPGVKDHGFFSSDHPNFSNCLTTSGHVNYIKYNVELCNGYTETHYNYQSVCKGHVQCCNLYGDKYPNVKNGHIPDCPGHELSYCVGDAEYTFTKTIHDKDESRRYGDWSYTLTQEFLGIEVNKTYSPLKDTGDSRISLARKDWDGWNDDNIELMANVLTDDWYLKYGYGISSFVGSEISPGEKSKYMESFNISNTSTSAQLMHNLNFAFSSIGRVAYYPGDKAEYPNDDSRNKFNTPAPEVMDNRGYMLAIHGLDYKYYADWVYLSTHEGIDAPNDLLSSNSYMCNTKITPNTPAGTPIVTHGTKPRSGILIGMKGNVVTYIGLSDTGWASVIDSTETWYTHPDIAH